MTLRGHFFFFPIDLLRFFVIVAYDTYLLLSDLNEYVFRIKLVSDQQILTPVLS
jgi:hypothetical protein